MKYRTCSHIFTLRSKFGSHCLIIWKYETHASNCLGDIRQTHRTMKYRSHRPAFILRSNVGSYWPIIPKYDVHISNSLQDITQNHWTMKYRSLPKYDVHTWNSVQDIRQNHWTMKYKSCWPSLYDPQVNVTRLSHARPTICISCFYNRKSRKTLFKGVLDFDL